MKSFIKTLFVSIACCMALTSCDVLGTVAQGMLMGATGMGGTSSGGYTPSYSSTSNAILNSEVQMANSSARLNAMGVSTYDSSSSSRSSSSTSSSRSTSTKTSYYTCCYSTATYGLDPGRHKCANCGLEHTKNSGHTCPIK